MTRTRKGGENGQRKVRVAIVGVGNCASSLVQGVHYYREASPEDFVPGLFAKIGQVFYRFAPPGEL